MWDQMKRFKSSLVHQLIVKCPSFKLMTEQTLYTIACDIATFREYQPGEVIVNQDSDSPYNIMYLHQEREAIKGLSKE